jgi:diguanylate cyclase (GGDEF)-like protein/PAS domain S-box-containing protein
MTTQERIRALFLRKPSWPAACAMTVVILLLLAFWSQRHWQHLAAALESENLSLRLGQLARDVAGQPEQLADRARDLAESETIVQLMQEASPDRAALAALTHSRFDALLVVSASQVVRFSATVADDGLAEEPPAPAMMQLLGSAVALRSPEDIQPRGAVADFIDGRWMAARPIMSRAAPASILGWMVVAQRPRSLGGASIGHAPQAAELASPPDGLLRPAASRFAQSASLGEGRRLAEGFHVTTHLSRDASTGYAVLRDAGGRAVWVFPLSEAESQAAVGTAPGGDGGNRGAIAYMLCALALLLAFAGAGMVTLKRQARRQRSADARYKAIIDQANDGVVIVDADSHAVLYANPAFLGRLGYTGAEAEGLTLRDIFADGAASPESVLSRLRDANSQMAVNLQQRCKNGALIDIEVRCNALEADGRDILAYVTHDVSLRRKAEQQLIENQHRLDRMAHHDQLTGLPNRHYLTAFLPDAIAAAQAAHTMLGVVFLDLDRFKHINDTRGHETGDKLLQEVATRLQAVVRESDVVIRMGGDEFVVIFRNVKSYDEVTLGAERIIETLNRPIIVDQHPLQTTGSVGVSLFPRDGSNMVELLKHSDTAMYQAKERGRNNVQVFSQIMNKKLKHRVAVEASLREALRLKQLDVHYQPFINLNTRKVVGLEALMRWRHPVHGMVPADQFIPVAEETGLIVPMGNFVLHRTLQNMSAWRKAGVPLVPMSLNIAPAQLQRGELQSTISTLLKSHGIRPQMLQLEMTERAMFDSHAPAAENRQDTMARLRDLGVKIAIDDFGTGYSSLSYLKHWRVDALKIDRSFVRDLVTDSSDLAIVSAIIAIARHLQIQVIAEGIEGYQQAEILRRLGCAVGQGFLFARPMAADQCLELLRDNAEPEPAEDEDMLAVFSAGRG